jgi:glycosyltransferase involved in cell wall biosynthesis
VPTTGYKRHISLGRIKFERRFARGVRRLAPGHERPDVIVLAEPALFTSRDIVALAAELDVPLMLDMGDLWPELFQIALPKFLRGWGRMLFDPLYRRRASLVRRSDGYVAVTRDYLALLRSIMPKDASEVVYWGVDVAGVRRELEASTPLPPQVSARIKKTDDFWVVYAGSLGPNYDVRTILAAAEQLRSTAPNVFLFIAGDGVSRAEVESTISARELTNCIFLGPLSAATVTRLYGLCDAALSTYVGASTVSMPIKAFDYFAAGLPIINSLGRDLGWFVETREVGVQYEPENPTALAEAIRSLAADRPRRDRLSANAARLGEEFDWRVQYAGFVKVVERVAAQPVRSRNQKRQ